MAANRRSEVRRVLTVTLGLNLVVLLLKATVGIWTGSLSLQADALHSVTDSANNILGLASNRLASPDPDREHPYGHQKFEALGALGIAAFLAIACFEILQLAAGRLFGQEGSGSAPCRRTMSCRKKPSLGMTFGLCARTLLYACRSVEHAPAFLPMPE